MDVSINSKDWSNEGDKHDHDNEQTVMTCIKLQDLNIHVHRQKPSHENEQGKQPPKENNRVRLSGDGSSRVEAIGVKEESCRKKASEGRLVCMRKNKRKNKKKTSVQKR